MLFLGFFRFTLLFFESIATSQAAEQLVHQQTCNTTTTLIVSQIAPEKTQSFAHNVFHHHYYFILTMYRRMYPTGVS